MKPGGETANGMNWGEIQIPFTCTAADTLATCPIRTNTKFDTVRNFTHYLRPGDHLLTTGDTSSVAAMSPRNRLSVVYVNDAAAARTVRLDLSGFDRVPSGTTVTPVVTSASGALVTGRPVRVRDRSALIAVPARSVTTLLVDRPVSGVAHAVPLVQPGHVYRLQGVGSGTSLTPSADGAALAIRTDDPADTHQVWTLRPVAATRAGGWVRHSGVPTGNRTRYTIATVTGQRRLATVDGSLTTVAVTAACVAAGPGEQWILSTTGDGTYTLVNVGSGRLLDVGGGATADGSPVGVWLPNSDVNQRWRIVDETVLGIADVHVFTPVGRAPVLPSTVVPRFRDGSRGSLPVIWRMPRGYAWRHRGTVTVPGVATDALGRAHRVRAEVRVDVVVATLASRAKTYVGGTPELPPTVTAVTRDGYRTQRPVVWDAVPSGGTDRAGVVVVTGHADAGDGRRLAATLRLQVTEPVLADAALAPGVSVEASFTEPGYSPAKLVNGDLTDKAWSNWRSGTVNPSDTLTVTLPAAQTVARVVTHFYSDWGRDSYARSLRVDVRTDTGAWSDVSGPVSVPSGRPAPAVAVAVPVSAGKSRAVRVVLDARPGLYMTVSEIEVLTPSAPGRSSDARASSISLDGRPLTGFTSEVADYTVRTRRHRPVVTAVATDPYARVAITQATRRTPTATVIVTSEDGSATRTYRIRFR